MTKNPIGDTRQIPHSERDPDRVIAPKVRQEVLARDGYRCRYCGLPVVHSDIRKIAHRLYPDEVPWNARNARHQHSAFQTFWLQFDHVEPHSHGGRSSAENVVISCALCNFAKDRHTLRQLDLEDPRTRPPIASDFDGLETLREAQPKTHTKAGKGQRKSEAQVLGQTVDASGSFFFPGATISSGYVNTPPIDGKNRWFKLGSGVAAIATERHGVLGIVIQCSPALLVRRGLDPLLFTEVHDASAHLVET
ncbi:MAG: HNH endonuclease [Rhodobacteraceae bacterium]|nr:HNH endonuclease [Paracoccaceae bacterium]